jgi:Flp pilus assembly pilin Flp
MKRLQHLLGARMALMLTAPALPSLKREEGQTLVEYALILALIAILVIVALVFLQGKISSIFSHIGHKL